jgi:hypothetical protein
LPDPVCGENIGEAPLGFYDLSSDGSSVSISTGKYMFCFTLPPRPKNYGFTWVERLTPTGGAAINSVTVVSPTSAVFYNPTVSVLPPNDPLPFLALLPTPPTPTTVPLIVTGDGTGASATAKINEIGMLTSVSITAGGMNYTGAQLSILVYVHHITDPSNSEFGWIDQASLTPMTGPGWSTDSAPILDITISIGTETPGSFTWSGDPSETSTPVYTVGVPSSNGTVTIENIVAKCGANYSAPN